MIDYQLDTDEVLLGELNCNAKTNTNNATCRSIAFTNKNIILVYKGMLGGVKEI